MKKTLIRRLILFFALSLPAFAAAYPSQNVNIILGASPGGPTDLTVRALIDSIPAGIVPSGISFTVTNMPDGSGLVAANRVTSSPKDGYTLGIVNVDLLNNIVRKNTTITIDQYIPLVFTQADPYLLLVRKDAPCKTFRELVEYIKARPGEVMFGDSGPGSSPHVAIVGMQRGLGLDININGYDNNLESTLAVLNGECQATVAHASAAVGYLQSGDVIPLAVTSPERLSLYPDVPGMGEVYPEIADVKALSMVCVAALAGTDPAAIDFLANAFGQSVRTEKFTKQLERLHSQPVTPLSVREMAEFFARQMEFLESQL
ncbi:MAG: tripartite tricarboxylate transporter substrate binding protein [Planctomycetota bacterium]|jgi:tripartite-type tricarboxylate transporter receptor subunit TctC|nr:tripartite tricarboxylate transporter substrate binding protein [Planctomycetota bacterium]